MNHPYDIITFSSQGDFGNHSYANNYAFGPDFIPWPLVVFAIIGIIAVILWSITWKGLALWKAAKKGSFFWFVILLIVNTFGILEIIYYYCIDKDKKDEDYCCKRNDHCFCTSEVSEKIGEGVDKVEKVAGRWWHKLTKRFK